MRCWHFRDTIALPLLSTQSLVENPAQAGLMFTVEQAVHCTVPGATIHSTVTSDSKVVTLVTVVIVNEVLYIGDWQTCFYGGLEKTYLQLCMIYSLCCNHSTLPLKPKSSHREHSNEGHCCIS